MPRLPLASGSEFKNEIFILYKVSLTRVGGFSSRQFIYSSVMESCPRKKGSAVSKWVHPVSYTHLDVYKRQPSCRLH